MSAVTISEVFRILSAADPSIGQIPQNHFCWAPVFETGTEAQTRYFYGRLLAGDKIGNSHAEFTRKKPRDYVTKVERVSGGYVVTGKKSTTRRAPFSRSGSQTFGNDPEGRAIQLTPAATRQGSPSSTIGAGWGNARPRAEPRFSTGFSCPTSRCSRFIEPRRRRCIGDRSGS